MVDIQKIGYPIFITEEMFRTEQPFDWEAITARANRVDGRRKAKARIIRRHCRSCRELHRDCRCE